MANDKQTKAEPNQARPNDFERAHDRDTSGDNAGEFKSMPDSKPAAPASGEGDGA